MNFELKLFYLSRDIAIGLLTPLINFIESIVELRVGILNVVGPRFFDIRSLYIIKLA
jgi:hypothetical protein